MNGGKVNFEIGGDVSPTDSSEEGIGGVIYQDEEWKHYFTKRSNETF
jgi:hypothetical protein